MMQPKTYRFADQGRPDQGTEIALTEKDAENINQYVGKIRETVDLLRHEIDAIKAGELEVIGQIFEEKSRKLKWLELRTPLIEPFLDHEFAQKLSLRPLLAELKRNIEEGGAMLARMAIAARTIRREVEKIHNRNGLDNVYGKTGEKLAGGAGQKLKLDQEL